MALNAVAPGWTREPRDLAPGGDDPATPGSRVSSGPHPAAVVSAGADTIAAIATAVAPGQGSVAIEIGIAHV